MAPDPALVERFKQALDRLNPGGERIGLAVSGGPDSMAMLLLAHAAVPGQFEVATVNHGLRAEAADECALVAAACAERRVECAVLKVTVAAGNVQAKAREARYAALADWARGRNLRQIATAHHADDQMETILMRLNRGSGISGLSGIREWTDIGDGRAAIRPVLSFTRAELAEVISATGVSVANDPSNSDTSYERARLRLALSGIKCLDPKGFAASARYIEQADMLCDEAVERWLWDNQKPIKDGLRSPVPPARSMHFPLLQAQFRLMGADVRGGALARLLDQLRSGKGGNVAGVLVTIEDGDWVFRPEPPRRAQS